MGNMLAFESRTIVGLREIIPRKMEDDRGAFFRTYCQDEFEANGIKIKHWPQINQSFNKEKGTFRGLHFQSAPFEEYKVVRCLQGVILDIVVDLRENSDTYLQHEMIELRSDLANQLFIPAGCAHGFQTLENNTSLLYLHSSNYDPSRDAGVSVFDPKLGITLPLPIASISDRDKNFANL